MKIKEMTEMTRNNRTVMLSHIIVASTMIVMAFLRFIAGLRPVTLFLFDVILGAGPFLAEIFFWKKDHETKAIKHLAAIGFATFFTYSIFTCTNNLLLMYCIPMILAVSVYKDPKLSIEVNTGTVILAILSCVIGAKTNSLGYENVTDCAMQIIVMILVAVESFYSARTANINGAVKIKEAMEAKKEAEDTLSNLQEVSQSVHDVIKDVYRELEKLVTASDATKSAMEQLSLGANDAAEAVQKQISQTQEIQGRVEIISDAGENIRDNMQNTLDILKTGSQDMNLLVEQVEKSVTNGDMVAGQLEKLDGYVEEMHSIVQIIGGIANQTSMLALNASIEAARAGDAGRGFAVVAEQVTNMAGQTKDATVKISSLIQNVSTAIGEVVATIRHMLEEINEEKETTTTTVKSFERIQDNSIKTTNSVQALVESIEELNAANQQIVSSIQTISAISEEVSAHAKETETLEEKNTEIMNVIDGRMNKLIFKIKNM